MKLLILLSIFSFWTSIMFGQVVNVLPVEDVELNFDVLSVSYRIPCGSEALGIVFKQSGSVLEVGVSTKKSAMQCVTLKPSENIKINGVSLDIFTQIIPMFSTSESADYRLRSAKVIGHKQNELYIAYQSKCSVGSPLVMLRSFNEKIAQVSLLETQVKTSKKMACVTREKVLKFHKIFHNKKYRFVAEQNSRIEFANDFKISSIYSVDIHADKIIVHYHRLCNEAPVGVVFRSPLQDSEIKLGMLVSRFYNHQCAFKNKLIVDKYELPNLNISKKAHISFMKDGKVNHKLNIKTPNFVKSKKDGIEMTFTAVCKNVIGTVVSKDMSNNLSIGALEFSSSGQCKTSVKGISLKQKMLEIKKPQKQTVAIYPLQIRGRS